MRMMSWALPRISSVSATTWPADAFGKGAGAATGAGAGTGAGAIGVFSDAVVMPGMRTFWPGKIRLEVLRPFAASTARVVTPKRPAIPLTVSPRATVYVVPSGAGAGAGAAGAGAGAAGAGA